jgi:hypothetical protein
MPQCSSPKRTPNLMVRDENGEIYTARYEAVKAILLNEFLKEQPKSGIAGESYGGPTKGERSHASLAQGSGAQIQKVSAQLELSKAAPQRVLNDQRQANEEAILRAWNLQFAWPKLSRIAWPGLSYL